MVVQICLNLTDLREYQSIGVILKVIGRRTLPGRQRTLTVGRSISVQLVSSFTSLDSTGSLYTKTTYFLCRSSPVLLNRRPGVQ